MVSENKPLVALKEKVYSILHDPDEKDFLEIEKQEFVYASRPKKFQVINCEMNGRKFGFIIEKQEIIHCINENENSNLGRLLMNCGIERRSRGGKRVEEYYAFRINLKPTGLFGHPHHLWLGGMFLMAHGTKPDELLEAHHILHHDLNLIGQVENISRNEHARKKPEFTSSVDTFDYVAKHVLNVDDSVLNQALQNIRFLARSYIRHRGITLHGVDIIKANFEESPPDSNQIILSVL